MFQPVPDTAQFVIATSYGAGGVPMEHVVYARDTAGWTGAKLQAVADGIADWWDAELAVLLSSTIQAGEVQARDITEEFGIERTSAFGAGTQAGEVLPPQVTYLVTVKGDAGTAPRRGTFRGFGLREADQNLGQLTGGVQAALEAAWQALPPAISAASLTAAQVIVSRFQGFTLVDFPDGTTRKVPTKRDPALTNTIDVISVDSFLRTTRGRQFPGV